MAKKEAPEGSLLREKSGERDLRMVHVVVLQGLAAIMAGLAVHMALGPVRAGAGLLVALVRALLDGFGGHIGALPVLALLNLGVENFAGPAGRVGGQPCAAFAAFLALFADAVGGAPAGDGNVAELGFGDGGLGLVEADLRVSGIVDREVRGWSTSGRVRPPWRHVPCGPRRGRRRKPRRRGSRRWCPSRKCRP